MLGRISAALVVALSLGFVSSANAGVVTATLGDIDGPFNPFGSAFPIDIGPFGPFLFSIPSGDTIVSATLGGTYGTAQYPFSTGGFDAIVDGTSVTVCTPYDPSCWNDAAGLRAFSISLPPSLFSLLYSGSASLEIIQTNENIVRYGTPTLTIGYVPEPPALALIGMALLSLLGLGIVRRRAEA